MTTTSATAFARFLHRIGRLKFVPRTGWLDRGVPAEATESVADHSFRMALLAWLAALDADAHLDADRVLKLALVHDLAESITGDEPPYAADAIPSGDDHAARHAFLQRRHTRDAARAAAKREAEAAAMTELLAGLSSSLRTELEALWEEYARQETPEARFVKQADRLETYLQSREYLADDPRRPMASFAAEVAETIGDHGLQDLRDAMAALALDAPEQSILSQSAPDGP